MDYKEGFVIKKVTKIKDLPGMAETHKDKIVLPESDLCIQDDEHIVQLDYKNDDNVRRNVVIKPGTYNLVNSSHGVDIVSVQLQARKILESAINTKKILDEVDLFFSSLDIYKELEQPEKRSICLHSPPGCGKTSAIVKAVEKLIISDKGTVVLVWPTSEVEADDLSEFLTLDSEYSADATKVILIVEDIGGQEKDEDGQDRVDSGLLNLLDGVNVAFKKPTFIIATTNYPDRLLTVLADRPGRFDQFIKLEPPTYDERCILVEFIAKRALSDEDKVALKMPGCETMSIAHLNEAVVRSRLRKITIKESLLQLIEHTSHFKKGFKDRGDRMGI